MAIEGRSDETARRRIRLGMVGGGQGAFIGAVHRIAARIDDQYELVAGALSSDAGARQGVGRRARPRARTAPTAATRRWRRREAERQDGIEAVAIVTPNHMHFPVGQGVPRGRHPRHLRQAADGDAARTRRSWPSWSQKTGKVFALTHNYTGYPMVRQAREMVADRRARRDPRSCRPNTRRTG